MSKTEKLKNIILSRYSSIREFSRIVDIPSTTLTSALDKDIGGMAVDRVIKICEILNINIKNFDPIENESNHINDCSQEETNHLNDFRQLNDLGKKKVINYTKDLIEMPKYTDNKDYLKPLAAHDKDGEFTKEDIDHDLNLMKDDSNW